MKKYSIILALTSIVSLFALPCRTVAQSLDEMLAERGQLVAQRGALRNERDEYLVIYNELTNQYNALVSLNEGWLDLWCEYQGLLLSITFAKDSICELQEDLDGERDEFIKELEDEYTYWDNWFYDSDGYSNPYLIYPGGIAEVEEMLRQRLEEYDSAHEWEREYIAFRIECIYEEIAWMEEDISWHESTLGNYSAYQTEIESVEAQRSWVSEEMNIRNQAISYLDQRIRNLDAAINALQGHP